jgi:hypothetical protein
MREKKCTHDGERGGSSRLKMCLLSRLDMQLGLEHSLLKISISENRASEMVLAARESGGDGEVSGFPDELAPNQTKTRTMPPCHPRLQRTTPSRSHPSRIYSACCSSICPAHPVPIYVAQDAPRLIGAASNMRSPSHLSCERGVEVLRTHGTQLRQTMNRDDLNSLRSPDGREDTGT